MVGGRGIVLEMSISAQFLQLDLFLAMMIKGIVGSDNGSQLTLRDLVIFPVLAFQFPQRDAFCIREQGQNADLADSLPHQLDHIVRRHLFDGGIQGFHHVQAQK